MFSLPHSLCHLDRDDSFGIKLKFKAALEFPTEMMSVHQYKLESDRGRAFLFLSYRASSELAIVPNQDPESRRVRVFSPFPANHHVLKTCTGFVS